MKTLPARYADRERSREFILHPGSPEFSTAHLLQQSAASTGTVQIWNANRPIAIPFAISQAIVVRKLGWRNGTSPGGNTDIGIYTTSFARLVSTGNTAGSGASVWQWVDITDFALPAGRYYLVGAHDSNTVQRVMGTSSFGAQLLGLAGVMDSVAGQQPLPDPLADMVETTHGRLPLIGLAGRVPL